VTEAVRALALPPDAVGAIVTLCWLHYAELTPRLLLEHGPANSRPPPYLVERAVRLWLDTPGLGPGWDLWRR